MHCPRSATVNEDSMEQLLLHSGFWGVKPGNAVFCFVSRGADFHKSDMKLSTSELLQRNSRCAPIRSSSCRTWQRLESGLQREIPPFQGSNTKQSIKCFTSSRFIQSGIARGMSQEASDQGANTNNPILQVCWVQCTRTLVQGIWLSRHVGLRMRSLSCSMSCSERISMTQ